MTDVKGTRAYQAHDRGASGARPVVPEAQKRVVANASGNRQERRKAARAAAKETKRQSGG